MTTFQRWRKEIVCKKIKGKFLIKTCLISFLVFGCAPMPPQKTAAEHQQELGSTNERKMTLGVVQSSIREGMSQADVAAALGSPNIVTQDIDGNDTWIYDKISTETSQSGSSQGQSSSVGAGIGGGAILGAVGVLGGIGGSSSQRASSSAGAQSQTQRTLTVVIKFNEKRLVSSVKYQTSSF